MVTVLTLFCLAQNSGLFNLAANLGKAQGGTAGPLSVLYAGAFETEAAGGSSEFSVGASQSLDADSSQAGSFEFKRCELSEKSMRLCLEDTSVAALLVLLFLLPLSPSLVRILNQAPRNASFLRSRRIHLTFCRFQE
ncbi:hypothetical protein [uncultured Shewanella sp.]|uniref:hypothetical protein n=1 Tax=uncultured Shewanella sp. TaxID=173975 RepID=UPI00261CBCAF|nr:hypothetical protein [uncultured Shewanella sp.]